MVIHIKHLEHAKLILNVLRTKLEYNQIYGSWEKYYPGLFKHDTIKPKFFISISNRQALKDFNFAVYHYNPSENSDKPINLTSG